MRGKSDLERDYRAALLRFLPAQAEGARATGYDIGRAAVEDGIGLLDLVQVHHAVVLDVMEQSPGADQVALVRTASEFLLEVIATFDLTHRALQEAITATPDSPAAPKR